MMILDTGMPSEGVSIFDRKALEGLDLEFTVKTNFRGAGGDPAREADVALGATVSIGRISISGQPVIHLDLDKEYITPYLEAGIGGIIGYMVFSRFRVGLYFTQGEIALYDVETFRPGRAYRRMPLIIRDKLPYIDVSITTEKKGDTQARLVVDSGAAAHPLQLFRNRSKGFVPTEDAEDVMIGTGISGEVSGYWMKIRSLTIDEYTLYDVVTSIPEKKRHSGVSGAHVDGNLGLPVLKRFDLIFDYEHGRLYLKPSSSFSEPFYPRR